MTVEDGRSATRVLARSVARCALLGSAVIVTWWLGESAASADESTAVPADAEAVAAPASPTLVAPLSPVVVAPASPVVQPVALVGPMTASLGEAVDDLVAPVLETVRPIAAPTLRATDPVLATVGGTVDGLVATVDAVSPVVKPALDATAPVTDLLATTIAGPAAPSLTPPVPVQFGEAVAPAEGLIPPPGLLAAAEGDDVESPSKPQARPALAGSVASIDDATNGTAGGEWPSRPAPAARAGSPAPASTATSPASSSRDLPDRTHDAMTTATALAHAAIPAAVAPLGSRVVGASENSGSRPSATPD